MARYIFLAMDEGREAFPTLCADEDQVRQTLKEHMWFLGPKEELDPERTEQLDANLAEILEEGALHFEGDPPLLLFKLGKRCLAPMTYDEIEARIGIDEGDREAVHDLVREVERFHGIW